MGILYLAVDSMIWIWWLFVLIVVMALNELARTELWCSVLLFVIVPIMVSIWILPVLCPMGNKYGTGNWFNWAKLYSFLAGVLGFMALRLFFER